MSEIDLHLHLLAQDGTAGMPGEAATSGDATTAAPGSATATPPTASPFGGQFMFIMLGLLVVMIILSTLGPRREKKRREAMLSAVKKHDRVQTVGGVIGAIVELKPDFVVLKVDESANTRITFARSAIQQVLAGGDEPVGTVDTE
ncbi:MAG: preprotein translocase subunit YajC [Phycisphaerales bacterium]|nr:preprotein translocase subunit YajC [Phycisphaerae bacterium]NNF44644.1 preprotein translocase subunit YajC [Phycisphaerales bacterium]NNM27256.1 preprotein translocase subunit YajC [Phycisphaerales bacterium]